MCWSHPAIRRRRRPYETSVGFRTQRAIAAPACAATKPETPLREIRRLYGHAPRRSSPPPLNVSALAAVAQTLHANRHLESARRRLPQLDEPPPAQAWTPRGGAGEAATRHPRRLRERYWPSRAQSCWLRSRTSLPAVKQWLADEVALAVRLLSGIRRPHSAIRSFGPDRGAGTWWRGPSGSSPRCCWPTTSRARRESATSLRALRDPSGRRQIELLIVSSFDAGHRDRPER